jgi:hypothetical protein
MKAIGSKTSQGLRTQNEMGQTAYEWANEQTDKPNNYVLPYYRMRAI